VEHVAIDLGGRESQICIRTQENVIRLEKRVPTRKLKEFFGSIEPSRIVLETCAEAFAVAGLAKDAGHDVRVVPATIVRSLGVAQRGIKTDQRDARALSEASVRIELASVHVPKKESREIKTACGMRETAVQARTQLINSVRGWLRGELERVRSGAPETFATRVRESRTSEKIPAHVERQLAIIEAITEQIKGADRDLLELAKRNERCRLLMSVPGVGPITSLRFVAAVDEFERFSDAHQLESYFGLTPGENSSSDARRRTSLTKAGSKKVRWVMVQAAWSASICRRSDPMVLWMRQIAARRGKQVAIAALARKMLGIMFAILRDRVPYNPSRASKIRVEPTDSQTFNDGIGVPPARKYALRKSVDQSDTILPTTPKEASNEQRAAVKADPSTPDYTVAKKPRRSPVRRPLKDTLGRE